MARWQRFTNNEMVNGYFEELDSFHFNQRIETIELEKSFGKRKVTGSKVRRYSSCIQINDTYIISAVRTPIGCFQGKLSSLNSIQLATKALTSAVAKAGVCKEEVQEIVLGTCFSAGLGQNPAHQVALYSGLPKSIVSSTVNKMCASGMKAIICGCQQIASNTHELVAVGGTESLSNVPYILRRKNMRLGNVCLKDLILQDAINDMFEQVNVTHFAEETVRECKYTRELQDDYALDSYSKAVMAHQQNVFAEEMIPIVIKKKGNEERVCYDEEINKLNTQKFRCLPPEVGENGTITVGNSSGFHDGAAMLILASGNYVLKKNLEPLARIVSYAEISLDSKKFVFAPSVAIPRALVRANLTKDCISLWEISETFAISALLNMSLLKINPKQVNVHGGTISLGHPFGMTGARIVGHLAHILGPGEFGCASICHVTGGASAMIIEKM